jgi:hypothetical protein
LSSSFFQTCLINTMNTTHRQNIESAWDNLLEAVSEALQDADKSEPLPVELRARLDTLHASLRGLGNAWSSIRDLLPAEPVEAPETNDAPGALPESAYWRPLAECLLSLGGSSLARHGIAAVGDRLSDKLTAVDREPLPSGVVRWVNRTQFARERLKELGLIRNPSRYGLWDLTEAGKRWASDPTSPSLPTRPIPQDNPQQTELPF